MEIMRKPLYLHVKVTGKNSRQTVIQYLADVFDACLQNNCLNVLIEENLQGPRLDTLEVFKIVTAGVRSAATYLRFIAYVDANPRNGHGLMHFAESLALTQGFNVRVFHNVQEAERWLGSQLSPGASP
jgi:hypothetical protein